jgi:predicted ArsR family transcriptional regulator
LSARSLEDEVLKIIESFPEGASLGEILEELGDADVTPTAVRKVLQKLTEERKVLCIPEPPTGTGGRPRHIYRRISADYLSLSFRAELVERKEREETVLRDILRDSVGVFGALPQEKKSEIYKKAAELLLRESPIDLLVEFAKWLRKQYGIAVRNYQSSANYRDREYWKDICTALEEISQYVFNRMLGVPTKGNADSRAPFVLRMDQNKEDQSALDEEELRRFLSYSVLGNSVIEIIDLNPVNPPIRIGGSDASRHSLGLSQILPWQTQRRELDVITAVGVRHDVFTRNSEFDIRPDPKTLAMYKRKDAINQGLLIPPSPQEEEMRNRIVEAAMDLRQYLKDYDVIFETPDLTVHFRDGRIFPMEHRFSDAIQGGTHGEMVRKSLRAFGYIVNQMGAEEGRVLFCGFVKRPGLDLIAPLIVWYIGFGSAESNGGVAIHPLTLEKYIRAPERLDHNEVVNRLFNALRGRLKSDQCAVTFRVVRRFQSMAEDKISNMEPCTDRSEWEKRLESHCSNISDEHVTPDKIRDFAMLCARAAIMTFYTSRPGAMNPDFEVRVIIPRIEILVPYVDLSYDRERPIPLKEKESDYVRRVLSVLCHENVLERYPEKLSLEDPSDFIFLAPRSVVDAHQYSKELAKIYAEDFLDLLAKEAVIFWQDYRFGRVLI